MLDIVRDLKEQYNSMKRKLLKRIAFLEQNNKDMKILLGRMHPLRFATNQFCSPRPTATVAVYSSTHAMHLLYCPVCRHTHPRNFTCVINKKKKNVIY